jgi:RsiW-degrading membrane proteinase PrsW (M82 family)
MDATEATGTAFPSAPAAAVPWLRWTLAFTLGAVFEIAIDTVAFAERLRVDGPPFPADARALIQVAWTAIGLALVVALPLLLVLAVLAGRTRYPRRAMPFALSVGLFAFALSTRFDTEIAYALGLDKAVDLPFDVLSLVLAPLLEEPMKLLAVVVVAVLVRRYRGFGVREGIIAGALVGLGANALEVSVNTQLAYADGREPMYGTILALRAGLFGFGLHATTTALLGAAVGFVSGRGHGLDRAAILVVLGALVVAAVGHVCWNLVGNDVSQAVLRAITPTIDFNQNGPLPQVRIFIASSVASLVVMAPSLVILVVAWIRARPAVDP